MSILVLLSYFDPFYGPKVYLSLPVDVSKEKEKEIVYFINVPSENRFIETISMEDKQKIINLPFTIHSDWARGYKELLLISVILEKNYKSDLFENTIRTIIDKIQNTPKMYKAFYKEQENFSLDPEIDIIQSILKDILHEGYQELNQVLKEVSLGNFLVLGLAKVGKTTILENLRTNVFNPNIKPTLAADVLKIFLDTFQFRAIDVSGQLKLRDRWWERVKKPDAIVFVVDGTDPPERLEETKMEFNKILDRFKETEEHQLSPKTPILICINKIDLLENSEGKVEEIKNLLELESCEFDCHLELTSAKTGEGIKKGFKWVFQELLKIA